MHAASSILYSRATNQLQLYVRPYNCVPLAISQPSQQTLRSDWLDPEVEPDEREDHTLEVLHQVVEDAKALRVLAVLHVEERPDLARRKGDVLPSDDHLKLLYSGRANGLAI
eukprot:scaffold4035_cov132-Isochrysis_galbana.AAC.7